MTEDKKVTSDQDCEDIVMDRKKERQKTMDKMSIDSSKAYSYDKDADDDDKKCS